MTRKIISFLLVLMLCLSISVCALAASANEFLYDEANLLSDSEEWALRQTLANISDACDAQIVVATVNSAGIGDMDQFAEYVYDSMDFGYGPERDGVLLLVCMDLRQYRILSNGYAGSAISGYEIDAIGEAIVDDLSNGYYADAFSEFADQCAYYLDGYLNGFPFAFRDNLVIALIVGILAGVITVLIMKGQLKSVRQQNQANVYVKQGSMQVNVHNDIFLYRNITRVKKENKSSSKSGSSRSVGGGSF